jgi:hypothetical protein
MHRKICAQIRDLLSIDAKWLIFAARAAAQAHPPFSIKSVIEEQERRPFVPFAVTLRERRSASGRR